MGRCFHRRPHSVARERLRLRTTIDSQFSRCVKEFRNALQETSGSSAIEDAMIEAKREGCFGYWDEGIVLRFPMWHHLPATHAEEQGLLR